MRKVLIARVLLILFACTPAPLLAHAKGEHYIWLGVGTDRLEGNVEIRAADLRDMLDLDLGPGPVDTADLVPHAPLLQDYVRERFEIGTGAGPLSLSITAIDARNFNEGNFVQIHFTAGEGQAIGKEVTVRDELFFEFDRLHRGILLITHNDRVGAKFREREALVFSPFNTEQRLNLDDPPRLLSRLQFIWQGMLHIFMGLDHVLFLISLLFTAVLVRREAAWTPVESFNAALWNVFKIVTLFTIAHSITLFLAGMGYLNLPSRLIESIIALSIIVVALNNLVGRFDSGKLWIILGFGLFHGLGFATVMAELPFRMVHLLWVVLFFNVGVELGQILIVAVVFPVLYALRKSRFYVPVVVVGASLVIVTIAAWWLAQRALNLG